jgi:hypothetical protein
MRPSYSNLQTRGYDSIALVATNRCRRSGWPLRDPHLVTPMRQKPVHHRATADSTLIAARTLRRYMHT